MEFISNAFRWWAQVQPIFPAAFLLSVFGFVYTAVSITAPEDRGAKTASAFGTVFLLFGLGVSLLTGYWGWLVSVLNGVVALGAIIGGMFVNDNWGDIGPWWRRRKAAKEARRLEAAKKPKAVIEQCQKIVEQYTSAIALHRNAVAETGAAKNLVTELRERYEILEKLDRAVVLPAQPFEERLQSVDALFPDVPLEQRHETLVARLREVSIRANTDDLGDLRTQVEADIEALRLTVLSLPDRAKVLNGDRLSGQYREALGDAGNLVGSVPQFPPIATDEAIETTVPPPRKRQTA